ncbi:hypothetical protein DSO57_1035951 [Entomophthora muscae]|uniref:Uncharacterized protein n=1 Tax=Entomophthora muscae TaxID=34485 RepID=A0ACC2S1I9_9FUNG|nr:hypothetical protein DSO57_1035951 [Entomophthora muscae]
MFLPLFFLWTVSCKRTSLVKYAIRVVRNQTHVCGGVLFTARIALTDSSCLQPHNTIYYVAIIQSRYNYHVKSVYEHVKVKQVITSPIVHIGKTSIVALVLDPPKTTSLPLTLDQSGIGNYAYLSFLLVGWSLGNQNSTPGVMSIDLYTHQCPTSRTTHLHPSLCLSQGHSTQPMCLLDPGSPLIYMNVDVPILIGIKGSCRTIHSSENSDVKQYARFIPVFHNYHWLKKLENGI